VEVFVVGHGEPVSDRVRETLQTELRAGRS
jgi:hypothetical protein